MRFVRESISADLIPGNDECVWGGMKPPDSVRSSTRRACTAPERLAVAALLVARIEQLLAAPDAHGVSPQSLLYAEVPTCMGGKPRKVAPVDDDEPAPPSEDDIYNRVLE